MPQGNLRQADLEDLSAYLDGELSGPRADQIRRLVQDEPRWREALRQLRAIDAALDRHEVPPAPADLPARIVRNVTAAARRRSRLVWTARIAVPAAAAAAILLIALLTGKTVPTQVARPADGTGIAQRSAGASKVNAVLKDIPEEDRFVVENLEFFKERDVVANYEVLEAIDRLEGRREVH